MLIAMLLASAQAPARDQVAQAVAAAFPSYDTDGDGKLDRAEFTAWMLSLKAQANPAVRPNGPAAKKWAAGAFLLADKDGNATVSRFELTGFLRQDQS